MLSCTSDCPFPCFYSGAHRPPQCPHAVPRVGRQENNAYYGANQRQLRERAGKSPSFLPLIKTSLQTTHPSASQSANRVIRFCCSPPLPSPTLNGSNLVSKPKSELSGKNTLPRFSPCRGGILTRLTIFLQQRSETIPLASGPDKSCLNATARQEKK